MYKDKQKHNEYHRNYIAKRIRRWRENGCCINCGIPCAPYWRCKEHRLKVSEYNKQYYRRTHDGTN